MAATYDTRRELCELRTMLAASIELRCKKHEERALLQREMEERRALCVDTNRLLLRSEKMLAAFGKANVERVR